MNSIRIGRSGMMALQAKAQAENDLLVWTIYDHPSDLPHAWVVRPASTRTGTGEPRALTVHFENASLENVRNALLHLGLTPLARSPTDDPAIHEVWI